MDRPNPQGTLIKLSDDKFKGKHPNNINVGFTRTGTIYTPPQVGKSCEVASIITSTVTEIVEKEETRVVFKTLNSTYELIYRK